jgi:hypothetical protein
MGLWAKEFVHLCWQDRSVHRQAAVDLENRSVYVVSEGECGTKSGRQRVIPRPDEALRLLKQARARRPDGYRLSTSTKKRN